MLVVWIIVEVLFLLCFFSLPPFAGQSALPNSEKASIQEHSFTQSQSHDKWSMKVWSLIQEQVIVLLAVQFVIMFNQTSIEVSSIIILYLSCW